jgi:hypothetical protein
MAFQSNFITMQDKHAKKLRTLSIQMAVTEPRAIFDWCSVERIKAIVSRQNTIMGSSNYLIW